jgi:hypothetical protein
MLAALAAVVAGGHRFVPDDIYFYLKIAQAIVRGDGSTFNGLQPTNGYHPLWMLFCVLGRALAGPDPSALIRVHFVISGIGNLVSILLAWRLARALGVGAFGVTPALVAGYVTYNAMGSELHLNMPLLLLSALQLQRMMSSGDEIRSRDRALFGVLLGLSVLARLDNVFTAVFMGLVGSLRGSRTPGAWVRSAVSIAAPAALVLLPYLSWNWIAFGHLVPISGSIKAGLSANVGWNPAKFGRQAWVLALTALLAPAFWLARGRRSGDFTLLALALGAAAHSLYVLFALEAVWTWYFAAEVVVFAITLEACALLAMRALSPSLARAAGVLVPAAAALVMPAVAIHHALFAARDDGAWYLDAAAWIAEHVPPGEGIATCCSPGAIAYFSQRSVMALDGLTGDFRFHERAARDGLYPALDAIGVRYLLSLGPRSRELSKLIAKTQRIGHGGEGPSFHGTIDASGIAESRAVGLYSGIARRHVGLLLTDARNLVGEGFCEREMGVWSLAPAGASDAADVGSARGVQTPERG